MDDATQTQTLVQKPSLTVTRRLKAPPAKVFQAWTDPSQLIQWFGYGAVEDKVVEIEPRPGGRYHFGFASPNGDRNDVMGVFREVEPDRRLVFSWAWKSTPERESVVTVDLEPDGEGTLMTFKHEQFFDEAARDDHNVGWTMAFERFEALLEQSA